MQIRSLDPIRDLATVTAFFDAIADYIRLERGTGPDAAAVAEFLHQAPPGCDPASSHRIGLYDGERLVGISEMALGYPGPTDAYIGFLAIAEHARGAGAGRTLLAHQEAIARAAGCGTIFLAVLDANPRARAFWQREGFTLAMANREVTLGGKTQLAHRLGKAL